MLGYGWGAGVVCEQDGDPWQSFAWWLEFKLLFDWERVNNFPRLLLFAYYQTLAFILILNTHRFVYLYPCLRISIIFLKPLQHACYIGCTTVLHNSGHKFKMKWQNTSSNGLDKAIYNSTVQSLSSLEGHGLFYIVINAKSSSKENEITCWTLLSKGAV